MNSRLKAAPTITLSAREMLGCSWVRTYLQEVTVLLGVNGSITDKQNTFFRCTSYDSAHDLWHPFDLNDVYAINLLVQVRCSVLQ